MNARLNVFSTTQEVPALMNGCFRQAVSSILSAAKLDNEDHPRMFSCY